MEQSEIPTKSTSLLIIIFGDLAIFFIGFSLWFLQFVSHQSPLSEKTPATQAPLPEATLTPQLTVGMSTTAWKVVANAYFHLKLPPTWKMVEEPNKNPTDSAMYTIMQSTTERDETVLGTVYDVHVMSNPEGKDAMAFAKSDILINWQQKSGVTYRPYPLHGLDAVLVEGINVGKGAFGPSVYIVKDRRAVQVIAEDPLANPNTYFFPVVNTFFW